MSDHTIQATGRNVEGKGASRRLRRAASIPAIIYGGKSLPQPIQLDHEKIWLAQQNEWFYSSILNLDVEGKVEQVLLRDMQRHPFKQIILHLDFQRVDANQALRASVPLHFLNEDKSPAGKAADVVVLHELNDVEVSCLPKDLPEFIEIDLSEPGRRRHHPPVRPEAAGRRGAAGTEAGQGTRRRRRDRQARQGRRRGSRPGSRRSAGDQGREEGRQVIAHASRRFAPAGRPHCFSIAAMAGLRLIVGLGNPGPEHARTRHNAGFWFIDALAEQAGARFGLESKLFGETAKAVIAGQNVWLLKPATFMNLSGKSITAALRYWKIEPEEMLVAHDELDLPPGVARLKFDGGHGGQNGLRDTMRLLGHGKFHRLRIGIGHPGHKDKVTPWVLGKPGRDDEAGILRAIDDAIGILPLAMEGNFQDAMTRLHTPRPA